MSLKNFVVREQRALPIFILADASGSMAGAKINELNLALREMVSSLNEVKDIRGRFQLCIITFGNSKVTMLQPLADMDCVKLQEVSAGGNTPMGEAFQKVRELIEDRDVVSSRSYAPTIVLISDGLPTDCPEELCENKNYLEWKPLKELHQGSRSGKSQRLALGIGSDADTQMLKAFVNHSRPASVI